MRNKVYVQRLDIPRCVMPVFETVHTQNNYWKNYFLSLF